MSQEKDVLSPGSCESLVTDGVINAPFFTVCEHADAWLLVRTLQNLDYFKFYKILKNFTRI